jgi:c-di-AMP phosphodiesterase-like protein
MCYTFLPDTRLWRDLNLNKLPFDEVKNDWYYYVVFTISLILLLVNLIYSVDFNGVVTTLLDTCFIILFGRYIYLYRKYLEDNELKELEGRTKKQLEENLEKNKKSKEDKKGDDK